jgi:uncharacterized membrane protein YoaK (UPF0700 family)
MMSTLTDVWQTLVPPAGDRHGPLSPLLLALTVVTGLVDAFSYLVLGHVFVANMTGNVVFLAFALVGAKGFSIATHLLALGAFAVGAVISGRLVARVGPRRGRVLAATTACESALVAASVVTALAVANPSSGGARYVLILLLGLTGGLQTGTARKLAVPELITTVLTRTIAGAAFESRLAAGTDSRIGRRGLVVTAMFTGALVGAFFVLHVTKWLGLMVALLLLVPVTLAAGRLSRSNPIWDRAS